MLDAIVWWAALQVLGLIALPIAAVLLRSLPDRGYSAAKILGLLLVGWLGYTAAMSRVVPFGPPLLLGCAALAIIFSGWLMFRDDRALLRELGTHYRKASTLRYILTAESLFALAYGLWAWGRAWNPNIVDQEKFMDFGFLNAILKSGTFPPNDIWLAGASINYYYFGYVLVAALTALSGVRSEVAFNLANATLFALTALGTFGAVFNLVAATIMRRYARVRPARQAVAASAPVYEEAAEPAAAPLTARSRTLPVRRSRTAQVSSTATLATPETALAEEEETYGADGQNGAGDAHLDAPAELVESDLNAESRDLSVEADASPSDDVVAPYDRTSESDGTSGDGAVASADTREDRVALADGRRGRVAYDVPEEIEGDMRRVPFFLSPYPYAILAALMVVAMGNLTTMFATFTSNTDPQNPSRFVEGNGFRFCLFCNRGESFNWWSPSRVIQDFRTTVVDGVPQKEKVGFEIISEFPAFSFVLGDMHPHVLALPLVLLAVAVAIAFSRRKVPRAAEWRDGLPAGFFGWLALALAALIAGSLYTTNTWDYPTYTLVLLGGMGLPYLAAQRRGDRADGWDWLRPWIVQSAILVLLSLAFFLPFHLTFKSLVGGQPPQVPENIASIPVLGWLAERIGGLLLVNTAEKTILGFLVIFGIFLAAIAVWLLYELAGYMTRRVRREGDATRLLATWGGLVAAILIAAFLLRFPLLALLLPLALIALYLIWREPQRIERNLVLGMFALAALIGLAVEVFFLRDNFQMRMNTLFKFYYQIWVLWAFAAGYGLWRTLHGAMSNRGTARYETAPSTASAVLKALAGLWAFWLVFLVLSGSLYAVYGVQSRQIGGQTAQRGLDGTTWIRDEQPGDYAAMRWLKANAGGGDVVLEAGRDEYGRPGRVSAFTGVPTLIAWDTSHEMLWRTNQPELLQQIADRRRVVNAIYQGVDPDTGAPLTAERLVQILNTYGVDYVFAGATERGVPGWAPGQANERMTDYAEGLFRQALPVAFSSGQTVVYRVTGAVAGSGVAPPTPGAAVTPGGPAQPDPNAPAANLFDRGAPGANRGQLNLPRGIARDAAGNFYVADTQNLRIQKYDREGNFLAMWGGRGNAPGQFAPLGDDATGTGPGGIAVDAAGNVYVADTWNHRVQKFSADGQFLATWGTFVNLGDPSFADDPDKDMRFYGPRGVAVGPEGDVYVTDTGNKRVLIFDANGTFKRQISSGAGPTRVAPAYPFNLPGEMNEPIGIAVDAAGNVYVADVNNRRIQKFDTTGAFSAEWPVPPGSWDPAPYLEPFLALDAAGNLYATAPTARMVLKFSPTGDILGQKQSSGDITLQLPTGITVDQDGTVYVVDTVAPAVGNLGTIP